MSSTLGPIRENVQAQGFCGLDDETYGEINYLLCISPAIGNGSAIERRFRTMARFLIEVPHEAEKVACARAVQVLLKTGSHFLTHADYGCLDGEHKAWMIVEIESKNAARAILPPAYRSQAMIVQLNKFSMEEIDEILTHHRD